MAMIQSRAKKTRKSERSEDITREPMLFSFKELELIVKALRGHNPSIFEDMVQTRELLFKIIKYLSSTKEKEHG